MKKKTLARILAFTFIFSFIVFQAGDIFAGLTPGTIMPPVSGSVTPPADDGQLSVESKTFDNPLGGTTDYLDVVANVVKVVLGIVGVLALVIFIYGGIVWMTSLGNAERVKQGRDTLVWASLGLIVVFASFAIVNLILSAFNTPKS